jgi:peptidyl-prolyl cis-trans isomerase A (cyclophilin A)
LVLVLLEGACSPALPPPPPTPIEPAVIAPPAPTCTECEAARAHDRATIAELEQKVHRLEQQPREAPAVAVAEDTGELTLAQALVGLPASGALRATITTSKGDLRCQLYPEKAPVTVANFVGLARGLRPFTDGSGQWVKRPAYDGTTFHRVIKGFMIQGGDPKGDGTGEPGYVFKDELWAGAKHDREGLLCMANRGPDTNGMQFFITDAAAAHLDRSYTIFGECSPASVVHAIASVATGSRDRPLKDVAIVHVEISRGR